MTSIQTTPISNIIRKQLEIYSFDGHVTFPLMAEKSF